MITCYFENGDKVHLRHVTVNAIVVKDDKILLGLRGSFHGKPIMESGKWAMIGGFLEHGENLTQAILREIKEESGWEVDDLQLFHIKDNPHRKGEDRANVEFDFVARAVRQIGAPDEEVKKLQWFPVNKLPLEKDVAFDHYDDLRLYQQYSKKPTALPIFEV